MAVLDKLEPSAVFRYFEEICGIPHGSSNTKMIGDYLINFAKIRNLKCEKDHLGNVIISKPGTSGYENSPAVIIQGHMDMVCEKTSDMEIDFNTEGLKLKLDGNVISAEGTTLGGDDGIAVAYALALLDSSDIAHPPLEVVITVDEEIGMLGAADIDCSSLKGRLMLNIDSEDEGHLLVSCAGGVTATCHLPVSYEKNAYKNVKRLSIMNVTGGHSGVEIIKEGANASKVLGRVLYDISRHMDFRLVSISGGMKDNAIPREAHAIIAYDDNLDSALIDSYNLILGNEYKATDENITVELSDACDVNEKCMTAASTKKVIAALVNVPNGISKMSKDIDGLVQTSLNLGILRTAMEEEPEVTMSFSVRSSVGTEKEELVMRLDSLMDVLGGNVTTEGAYPAWEYKRDSKLRELMAAVYKEMYGKEPIIEAIHAGVECGLFAGKLEGLDCVSFGPQIDDIHTPNERLYVDSVQRTWKYLLEVLRRLK